MSPWRIPQINLDRREYQLWTIFPSYAFNLRIFFFLVQILHTKFTQTENIFPSPSLNCTLFTYLAYKLDPFNSSHSITPLWAPIVYIMTVRQIKFSEPTKQGLNIYIKGFLLSVPPPIFSRLLEEVRHFLDKLYMHFLRYHLRHGD